MADASGDVVSQTDSDDAASAEVTVVRATAETYSGPLPQPQAMNAYEDALPGAADRILTMAEQKAEQQRRMEQGTLALAELEIHSAYRQSFLGLVFGAVVAVVIVAGGAYMAFLGHAEAGAGVIGGTIVGMAATFVYGARMRGPRDH